MADMFREIITKAVVAKGRKYTKATHKVICDEAISSVLGCWIINHHYEAKKKGNKIEIQGCFDVNVWVSYDDNSKTDVVTHNFLYTDIVHLKYRDADVFADDQIFARALKSPNCLDCQCTNDGKCILLNIEREFLAEIVGETKICVAVAENNFEEDWERVVDDAELSDIRTDFLKEIKE